MADWLGKRGKKKKNANGNGNDVDEGGLSAPLLPHGSDDEGGDDGGNNAALAGTSPSSLSSPPSDPERAAALALARVDGPCRVGSRLDDDPARRRRRRLRRLSDVQRRLRRLSSVASGDDDDVVTQPISSNTTDDDDSDEDSDEDSDYSAFEKEVPRERMSPASMAKGAIVAVVTCVGIAAYGASLVVVVVASTSATATATAAGATATAALGTAAGVCILTAPLVWVSEWRLNHMSAMRQRVNDLRNSAEYFQKEADMLNKEEADLRAEMEFLQEGRDRLEVLVKEKNAGNVDDFVTLVHDNQVILRQMREYLRQVVLQDVVRIVLRSDVDRDMTINRREASILEARLSLSLEMFGIVFDTAKFRRAVGLSPSLYGVLRIVRRLLPPPEVVTAGDDDDYYSEEGYGRGRSGMSFYDPAESDKDDDDDNDDDEDDDDVYDMYYVPVRDEVKKGCAESIRLFNESMLSSSSQRGGDDDDVHHHHQHQRPQMLMSISFGASTRSLKSSSAMMMTSFNE